MAINTDITAIQATSSLNGFGGNKPHPQTEAEVSGNKSPANGRNLSAVPTQEQPPAKPAPDELESLVSSVNEVTENEPPHLKFTVDEDTGHTVVTISQRDSGEILRQIPSEEFLHIAKMILDTNESLAGQSGQFIEAEA